MAGNPDPKPLARRPFRPVKPVVIGITGGVAAGKSTIARLFRDHGLVHVDADEHARRTAEDPAVLAQLRAEFGDAVVPAQGLDREALAEVVFAHPERRRDLERILHPPIRSRILAELDACRSRGESVLLDAPLMFETGLVDFCDLTVFVEASAATRLARAAARGWPPGELERREAAQLPLAVKKQRSSHIIANDGDLAVAARAVARLIVGLAAEPD